MKRMSSIMATVKSGIQDKHINQMIEMVEEYLQALTTPEAQRLKKELDDTVRPHKGHFADQTQQKAQDTAITRARHAYLRKYFPNLQNIMFPVQTDGSLLKIANRDMMAINNALKQAISALPKSTERQSASSASKENNANAANEKQKPAAAPEAKSSLKHKLRALNTAKNSPAISRHPEVKAHIGLILEAINSTSNNKSKKSIIESCFPDLGDHLRKGVGADTTTPYIIKETKTLLANLNQQRQISVAKPVTPVGNPPKQPSAQTVKKTPTKPAVAKTAAKIEVLPQKSEKLLDVSKALGFLVKYKEHLEKESKRNPHDPDLNTKKTAVKELEQKLYNSWGDKNEINKALLAHKNDISFSRNPVLRLFKLKTVGWGTTGDKCMQNIEQSFKEQTTPQTKANLGPR